MGESERYRAWVYHRTLPAKIVETRDAYDLAVATGWADTPAAFLDPLPDPPKRERKKHHEAHA